MTQQVHDAAHVELVLDVGGMTCGSCAARVEKVLSRQPGVHAARVNFATHQAVVIPDEDLPAIDELQRAVAKIGYSVTPRETTQDTTRAYDDEQRGWLRRVIVGALLAAPVF